jgi:hypothetical protein
VLAAGIGGGGRGRQRGDMVGTAGPPINTGQSLFIYSVPSVFCNRIIRSFARLKFTRYSLARHCQTAPDIHAAKTNLTD